MTIELESGLIIPFPEVEPAVEQWRRLLDYAQPLGVPAHVTVLYPFLPPGAIDDRVSSELRGIFAATPAFDVAFHEVGWFGEDVVYAAPSPDEPFRAMTSRLFARWPECPPYGGAHGEPTPHLTIGDHGSAEQLRDAEAAVASKLPVWGKATEVWLMTGSAETRWERREVFPLAS